jgi:hypothetical protein
VPGNHAVFAVLIAGIETTQQQDLLITQEEHMNGNRKFTAHEASMIELDFAGN